MNPIQNILLNKHTSIAGVVYLAVKTGTQLATVWWPDHKDKLETTASIVEGAAVAYGLLAAGDASTSKSDLNGLKQDVAGAIKTGNTDVLTKPAEIKTAADLGKL